MTAYATAPSQAKLHQLIPTDGGPPQFDLAFVYLDNKIRGSHRFCDAQIGRFISYIDGLPIDVIKITNVILSIAELNTATLAEPAVHVLTIRVRTAAAQPSTWSAPPPSPTARTVRKGKPVTSMIKTSPRAWEANRSLGPPILRILEAEVGRPSCRCHL